LRLLSRVWPVHEAGRKTYGTTEDAQVIELLVRALTAPRPKKQRPYYTVTEATELFGVSGQAVKNWISRGVLKGYRWAGAS
jgi:hypothetical protein